jgi:hypothetical protein
MVEPVAAAFLSLLPLSCQPVKYVRGSTKYGGRRYIAAALAVFAARDFYSKLTCIR